MSVGFGRIGVMRVVRGQQRRSDFARDRHEVCHDLTLRRYAVVLDLDEEVPAAKYVLIHGRGAEGSVVVAHLTAVALLRRGIRRQELGDVAPETSARCYEALGMFCE